MSCLSDFHQLYFEEKRLIAVIEQLPLCRKGGRLRLQAQALWLYE